MAAADTAATLCDQFGLDAAWRAAQLALVDLAAADHPRVELLHERVLGGDSAVSIIDDFYVHLLKNEQAARLLASFDMDRLKKLQVGHLQTLGRDFDSAAYFEARLRVGIAHARVGVPLGLYLAAFGYLQVLVLYEIEAAGLAGDERQALVELVVKLNTLDVTLAAEVYHRTRVQDLQRSVRQLEHERRQLRDQLQQDALTGVSSRVGLLEEIGRALDAALRTGQPLCLIMADLDHFKQVNDTHGHAVGDAVLREVAGRIKAALREFDLVGRYGGEEFVVLLENTSLHTAHQVAERVRRRIADQPVKVDEKLIDITVSQGLALATPQDDPDSLLRRADQAMYQAKQAGRNCIAEA
ncbi:MAG TPA: diguanylate cyclase [Gammaproteobacteria bacterium]|nr:diguanylate cyclase [Gammaproteobacteria bacterium]